MRELNNQELAIVSGGTEIVCSIGIFGVSCTGTIQQWLELGGMIGEGASDLYESAIESTTDLFEWMFGDDPEEAP